MQSFVSSLAKREAQEIREKFPLAFRRTPISASLLARAMGIIVDSKSTLGEPGRLEQVGVQPRLEFTIRVSAELDTLKKRVVVAHEIGHAVLASKYPKFVNDWDTRRREEFAHAFAHEVLIPPAARDGLFHTFREALGPLEVIKLASQLGLLPSVVFAFARDYSVCTGLSRLWLRVEYRSNASTGRDPKLRVISVICDRSTLYVPSNIGVSRLGLSSEWLLSLGVGCSESRRLNVQLWQHLKGETPRYKKMDMVGLVSAVRLRTASADGAKFIALVDR